MLAAVYFVYRGDVPTMKQPPAASTSVSADNVHLPTLET
jgi:hypothetical protein